MHYPDQSLQFQNGVAQIRDEKENKSDMTWHHKERYCSTFIKTILRRNIQHLWNLNKQAKQSICQNNPDLSSGLQHAASPLITGALIGDVHGKEAFTVQVLEIGVFWFVVRIMEEETLGGWWRFEDTSGFIRLATESDKVMIRKFARSLVS